jgi:glycosyltransferase involved in cell wall biosynthesis
MKNIEQVPLVSVITPVLNGEATIEENIQSIKNQTYPNIEHIVVDNFSTDRTREIAESLGVKYHQAGPERVAQDNYGVRVSDGKYVFISGSDLVIEPEYISQCVEKCEREGYDAIYASVLTRTTNYISKVKGLERELYIGDDAHEAARFFNKDIFINAGMYDESMVLHGDDYEMQKRLNRLGYKTGRVSAREYHLDELESFYEVFLKSFYYGYNSRNYINKYGASAVLQLSPIRTVYFKKVPLFLKNINLIPGFVVFKFLQYTSASLGLLASYLKLDFLSDIFHKLIYNRTRRCKKKGS